MSESSQFYDLSFDITKRELTVVLDAKSVPSDFVTSSDGNALVGFLIARDGNPYVVNVTICDPNRVSILQDWIEEAIEAAITELDATPYDNFGDNHWKGFRGGAEEGQLSEVDDDFAEHAMIGMDGKVI